ncbi:4-hydroxythreonine-4-phosphate dehydrogenase PdxA [Bacteriovoracales bacterium]|nr:4-hydroxythreonine-4-phosphate dehydrogenase PdxA [Bacteriovoracales bacterium]
MIYITQGHENSISLEILIKSFILIPLKLQEKFCLVVFESTLIQHLSFLKIKFKINKNGILIGRSFLKCYFLKSSFKPQSTDSILKVLQIIKNKDILLTLPTSKDQLWFENKKEKGHTEFFRKYFKQDNLSMLFSSGDENILLISDHIPIKKISSYITSQRIFEKVSNSLKQFEKYFNAITEVFLIGLNPHAGENGLLGNEEKEIEIAISSLRKDFPKINFQGPFPGDGIHLMKKNKKKNQLYVYMYHDQGLSPFKQKYGLIGLHITLGLPFLRMSVDHGTGFELYGKNKANPMGCYHLLKKSVDIQYKIQ